MTRSISVRNFFNFYLQIYVLPYFSRKMLDEDIREVRKLQEMFFEDEEKDGVGRQRTFRWKNAEAGFSLDDSRREGDGDAEAGESGDDENEQLWRKIRFEREQLLQKKGLKEVTCLKICIKPEFNIIFLQNSQEINSTILTNNTTILAQNNTTLTAGTVKKTLNIITAKTMAANHKSLAAAKKSSPFLIHKAAKELQNKSVRGSFLVRDKETLQKLAGLTKGLGAGNEETAGTVSTKAIKSKNFVFATLTEEEHEVNIIKMHFYVKTYIYFYIISDPQTQSR